MEREETLEEFNERLDKEMDDLLRKTHETLYETNPFYRREYDERNEA
ncbi:hypothetical protein BC7_00035 [Bacillus phage BC-7]|nr:hypothetical protein BC7_00035 [Bacillus phage BC-7]